MTINKDINTNTSVDKINQENTQSAELQAKKIASILNANANQLSMRTLKKLETSRELALSIHAQQSSNGQVNRDGTLSHFMAWTTQHRIATLGLLIGAIFFGFMLMQTMQQTENSDAFLLGADLPPEAFVDIGFEPSLNIAQAKI